MDVWIQVQAIARKLTGVTSLNLDRCDVGDAGLLSLSTMTQLEVCWDGNCALGNERTLSRAFLAFLIFSVVFFLLFFFFVFVVWLPCARL